jgi:hypothetical protein
MFLGHDEQLARRRLSHLQIVSVQRSPVTSPGTRLLGTHSARALGGGKVARPAIGGFARDMARRPLRRLGDWRRRTVWGPQRLQFGWLDSAGPPYRAPRQSIGMDLNQYASHSLRAGLATSVAAAGASERSIMNQTRHRSTNTVRRYMCDADVPLSSNAVRFTGL